MKFNAFTLIELLVVLVIIGVLATAISIAVLSTQTKARDSRRWDDFSTIKKALDNYYLDNNNYPGEANCDSSIGSSDDNCETMIVSGDATFQWDSISSFYADIVGKGYLSTLPTDPTNDEEYYYWYEPEPDSGTNSRQCYFWTFYTETSSGTGDPPYEVQKHLGDLSPSASTPKQCDY